MQGLVQQFGSFFGGFVMVYSAVAVLANDFSWAIDHIFDILVLAFFSALFVSVYFLFTGE